MWRVVDCATVVAVVVVVAVVAVAVVAVGANVAVVVAVVVDMSSLIRCDCSKDLAMTTYLCLLGVISSTPRIAVCLFLICFNNGRFMNQL